MEDIKWVELQNNIKLLFSSFKMRSFNDVVEKDVNGWNWILNFEDLRTESSLIIHTKFIFKLDKSKEKLRKLEFLYLKDLNCIYKIIKFDDFEELNKIILKILKEDLFGVNLKSLNEFLIEPERNINSYLFEHDIKDKSVFLFEYKTEKTVVPCQKIELNFNFNINNTIDVDMKIKKIKTDKFKVIFKVVDKDWITETEDLSNIRIIIGEFIKTKI